MAEMQDEHGTQIEQSLMVDAVMQTDECAALESLKHENDVLRKKLQEKTFGNNVIRGNDKATKFYTGLPLWVEFLHLFLFLSPLVPASGTLSGR